MILIYKNVNDLYVTIIKVSRVLRSDRLAERIGTKDFGGWRAGITGAQRHAAVQCAERDGVVAT